MKHPILAYKVKPDILPLFKSPVSVYSTEGLTFDHMNIVIHNIIQKEESELKIWLNQYNKCHTDKGKNTFCRKTEGKKIDHLLAYKLLCHILNNAHEKATPITPNIT